MKFHKSVLLALMILFAIQAQSQKFLKFELEKIIVPWQSTDPNVPGPSSPIFFGNSYQYLYFTTSSKGCAIMDLGDFETLPSDTLQDISISYIYGINMDAHSSGKYTNILDQVWVNKDILGVWGIEDDNNTTVTFWNMYSDKQPVMIGTIETYEKNNETIVLSYSNFKGFNANQELLFYNMNDDDIDFVTLTGVYVSRLFNEEVSLSDVGGSVTYSRVLDVGSSNYLIISQENIALVNYGATGAAMVLQNKDYAESFYMGTYEEYSVNWEDNIMMVLYAGDIYNVNYLTGNVILEISEEEIGFSPDYIRSVGVSGDFMISSPDDEHALLSTEWIQEETRHRLQVLGKGFFPHSKHDMLGNRIISADDFSELVTFNMYRWSIEESIIINISTHNRNVEYKESSNIALVKLPFSDSNNKYRLTYMNGENADNTMWVDWHPVTEETYLWIPLDKSEYDPTEPFFSSDSLKVIVSTVDGQYIAYVSLAISDLKADFTSSIAANFLKQENTIYPNPTNGITNVKSEAPIRFINVYNVSSTLVLSSKTNTVDMTTLDPGIYFFEVNTAEGVAINKVIKK